MGTRRRAASRLSRVVGLVGVSGNTYWTGLPAAPLMGLRRVALEVVQSKTRIKETYRHEIPSESVCNSSDRTAEKAQNTSVTNLKEILSCRDFCENGYDIKVLSSFNNDVDCSGITTVLTRSPRGRLEQEKRPSKHH